MKQAYKIVEPWGTFSQENRVCDAVGAIGIASLVFIHPTEGLSLWLADNDKIENLIEKEEFGLPIRQVICEGRIEYRY